MKESRRKWWVLVAISTFFALIYLDATVLPVALPTIQKAFNASPLALHWIVNAYFLALASLVLGAGRIADLMGHRKIFCLGNLVFIVASVIGGMSVYSSMLIVCRIFQGVGAALMSPAGMAILVDHFPGKERGKAIGIAVSIGSIFLSLGPFLGGFFTEFLSWRFIFWINIPISIVGLVLIFLSVQKSKKLVESFDLAGFLALSAGLVSFTLALMEGGKWGWSSLPTLSLFIGAALFLSLLFITDRKARHPLIDFKLFRNPVFLGGNLIIFLTQFVLTITVFWPIFFQKKLHFSPMEAGAITMIATLPVIFGAPVAGHLTDRLGPRMPMLLGFFALLICFVYLLVFPAIDTFWGLLPPFFAFGIGIPFIMTPGGTSVLMSVQPEKRGAGSGIYNTLRFTGGSCGVAILGGLFTYFNDSMIAVEVCALAVTCLGLLIVPFAFLKKNSPLS